MSALKTKMQTQFLLAGSLIFLLVLVVFGFLGYCSFPNSDDFIMAQDTSKGFFWALIYWLGFWLSSWTTAATELSIPLAFGYYDYGLPFYFFISVSLFLSYFFLFKTISGNYKTSFAATFLLFSIYLIYVPNVAEVYFWVIGALVYTLPMAALFSFIALHWTSKKNLTQTSPGRERAVLLGLIFISSICFALILKKFGLTGIVQILDKLFPPNFLYVYWILGFSALVALFFLAKKYFYVNHLLLGLCAFLVVGMSPQVALFLMTYVVLYMAFEYFESRSISKFSVYLFLVMCVCFIILMKMPGTAGRMSLTNPNVKKDFLYYFNANLYMLKVHFWERYVGIAYLITAVLGLIIQSVFSPIGRFRKEMPALFLLSIFSLHFLSIVLYHFSNGHFPLRLSCNFILLNFLLSFGIGFTLAIPEKIVGYFQKWSIQTALLAIVLLFGLSPNFLQAIQEVSSGEAMRFRQYKLAQFETINNCQSDTCLVPYDTFNLKLIPNQEFIFPNEKGFVLSHKYFISRYFKKEYIKYDPATLPKKSNFNSNNPH